MSNLRPAPAALDSDRVARILAMFRPDAAPGAAPAARLRLGVPDTARPAVKSFGIQNGAAAIAFLRSSGVSVRAIEGQFASTWLVSGEVAPLDLAAVVAIATQRGFRG